eukprot:Gregarina_sp_Poly_1__1419@NODE_1353_length_4308_cov_234_773638_g907_i0_p2_GENE_NODE_1353_length_4308_cov_234_773638_g907_i0NODE_1353_length_4308_cov_234_773638_g907_i0_p2_ORF_typecomplete_len581_score96_24Phosphorylase/PF00343_20/2_3e99_NODE_1353_length_4308_cov_234_773638_g907_i021733915
MAVQLNDTHPTIGIPEFIRILVDVENIAWDVAVSLSRQVFYLTNHTTTGESLEKWPAGLIERLLPRHIRIINDLNFEFLNQVRCSWGDVNDKIARMSVYEEGRNIRMANLAVICCRRVNGVAALQSDLICRDLFPDFAEWFAYKGQPDKFINVTNGVTPRRWIHCANRPLSDLISSWLGSDSWLKDLDMIAGLLNHVDDDQLISEWADVKRRNKERLARWVVHLGGPKLDANNTLFDVHVTHIDEYKRQHLNAFWMLHYYLTIKAMPPEEREKLVPRASLLGGKAAPGASRAKALIKMIHCLAAVVNGDADVSPFFKIFFIPNYNLSAAQIIVPGADVHQHTSLAGSETAATVHMKFILNGALFLGTVDGATAEMIEETGRKAAFTFGAGIPEVAMQRHRASHRAAPLDARLAAVFDFVRSGKLARDDTRAQHQFEELLNDICHSDTYLICHDFPDYCRAQQDVARTYGNSKRWWRLSITAAASMGKFSSDRAIREYALRVWNLVCAERPPPGHHQFRRLASGSGSPKNMLKLLPDAVGLDSNEELASRLRQPVVSRALLRMETIPATKADSLKEGSPGS